MNFVVCIRVWGGVFIRDGRIDVEVAISPTLWKNIHPASERLLPCSPHDATRENLK